VYVHSKCPWSNHARTFNLRANIGIICKMTKFFSVFCYFFPCFLSFSSVFVQYSCNFSRLSRCSDILVSKHRFCGRGSDILVSKHRFCGRGSDILVSKCRFCGRGSDILVSKYRFCGRSSDVCVHNHRYYGRGSDVFVHNHRYCARSLMIPSESVKSSSSTSSCSTFPTRSGSALMSPKICCGANGPRDWSRSRMS